MLFIILKNYQISRNKFNKVCAKDIYEKNYIIQKNLINGKINCINSPQANLYIQCNSNQYPQRDLIN